MKWIVFILVWYLIGELAWWWFCHPDRAWHPFNGREAIKCQCPNCRKARMKGKK